MAVYKEELQVNEILNTVLYDEPLTSNELPENEIPITGVEGDRAFEFMGEVVSYNINELSNKMPNKNSAVEGVMFEPLLNNSEDVFDESAPKKKYKNPKRNVNKKEAKAKKEINCNHECAFKESFNDKFIPVDQWGIENGVGKGSTRIIPEEDQIFKNVKGAIILPVSEFYKIDNNPSLDYFVLSIKRCYNSDDVRNHITHYLNYFSKFYDEDKELQMVYYKLKYLIDYEKAYDKNAFFYDLKKYILSGTVLDKFKKMCDDNYCLDLNTRGTSPALQYTNKHAKALMEVSLLMNACIPLLIHFIYRNNVFNIKGFLLDIFDYIINMNKEIDIYNKLYETTYRNINNNKSNHDRLWKMQSIRAKNGTIQSNDTVENIILQIIPKYTFDRNMICFNYNSILTDIKYKVTDISYEHSFIALSSSRRDEDNNSEFDKYESHMVKQDESLYLQNKVNCEEAMSYIERTFGPFSEDEINFYIKNLTIDHYKSIINPFQKELIFYLFYQYFGDPNSIKGINKRDYVILMIAAKRILLSRNMVILPHIISSNIVRLVSRKTINKKEMFKFENSPYFPLIQKKYKNDKIIKHVLSKIAVIISSTFKIIDYDDPEIDGKIIEETFEFASEEILMYILMI